LNAVQPRRGLVERIGRRRWNSIQAYLFISPWLLGFFIFTAGPMVASLFLSFTNSRGIGAIEFTGLRNYQRLVNDEYFWISLYNTSFYTFLGIPLFLATSLCYALLLNTKVRGISLYRTVYYLPSLMPAVANAIIWVWIFNPEFGFANAILRWLGLPPLGWFADPQLAKPSLILMGLWGAGSQTLIFLAALQGIPQILYEAAVIDGATVFQRFFRITLPMLTPSIFFNLVVSIIGSFQIFTVAYVATGGGPINATLFYLLYLYNMAFKSFFMGYASALAWVLFLIILVFTLIQVKTSGLWVYYEAEGQ
jgi:multiple sugar transport system permease protein